MEWGVIGLQDSDKWEFLLNRLPVSHRDVYFTPAFYRLFENKHDGIAQCFFFENDEGMALYPFLLNEVNSLGYDLDETYFDIQAPYGYNGMLGTTDSSGFLKSFSTEFKTYCKEKKIIAEMIRFNPVLKNESRMPDVEAIHVLDNVAIDLSRGYEHVWNNSYEKDVRRIARKAEGSHLQFEYYLSETLPEWRLESFKEIYLSTMKRNNARRNYYFNDEFFSRLIGGLPCNSIVFFVIYESKPVSAELVLLSNEIAYPYLGGTLQEFNYMSPNTLLRHKLLPVLCDRGIRCYSMGGGLSRNDSLFKYKRSFSKECKSDPIYIGSRIHNESVYKEVVRQWSARFPALGQDYKNYVLKYRYSA